MSLHGNEQIKRNAGEDEAVASILTGEAPTINQNYHNPEVDLMVQDKMKEEGMIEIEDGPIIYMNNKQLKGLVGLRVGDEIVMKIKCCVKGFSYNENEYEYEEQSEIVEAIVNKRFSYDLQIEEAQIENIEKSTEDNSVE